jgi:hypothetical protein
LIAVAEPPRKSPHVEPPDLPPGVVSEPPEPLDYQAVPNYDPGANWVVRGAGVIVTLAGLCTWFSAYAGVDDMRQVTIGIIITGFGITWFILGLILRKLEEGSE